MTPHSRMTSQMTLHRLKAPGVVAFLAVCLFACPLPALADAGPPAGPAKIVLSRSDLSGGLCVFVGAGDLPAAVELARTGRFLVQVIEPDAGRVEAARREVRPTGLYGLLCVDRLPAPGRLPFAEGLVNVIVLPAAAAGQVAPAEIARALCPRGILLAGGAGGAEAARQAGLDVETPGGGPWTTARKPWPRDMDTWPHPRHSASGNAVSADEQVGPPRRVRWVAGPAREISNLVTADGRNYYGGVWARDSFNGLPLWEKALAPSPARGNLGYRHTPGSVPPVAADGKLFAVTGGKLLALDGATGRTVREYPEAGTPTDLLCADGVLVVCDAASVRAVEAAGGKLRWRRDVKQPQYMVAGEGGVFFLEGDARRGEALSAVCLDLATGSQRWRHVNLPELAKVRRMVAGPGVVAFEVSTIADEKKGNGIHVVDASDGRLLWGRPFVPSINHMKQARALFVGEALWVLEMHRGVALEPRTGRVLRTVPASLCRCFPPVATTRFLFSGELDLTDLATGRIDACRITKAACGRDAGWVPANGLIYLSPKHCVCWPMLRGYVALAPARPGATGATGDKRPAREDFAPEAGPAPAPAGQVAAAGPWPCYRADAWRSGGTDQAVGDALDTLWTARLGGLPDGAVSRDWRENPFVRGPVTPPVVAGGLVYVARPDAHEVVALDLATGEVRWRASANGRVDTPPTIHRGLCLFGTSAGWVYCLRADDGRVVWRLRAAPTEERIVAYGQVESPRPVAGSVLVVDGLAYFAAGRHCLADGGVLVFAVEPATGRVRWVDRIDRVPAYHARPYKLDANTQPHDHYYTASALEFDPIDLMCRENGSATMSRWQFDLASGRMTVRAEEGFALLKLTGGSVVVPRGCWSYGPRNQSRVPGGEHPRRPLVVYRGGQVFASSSDRRSVFRRDFTDAQAAGTSRKWLSGWSQSKNSRDKTGEVWRNDRLAAGAAWQVPATDPAQKADLIAAMVLAGDRLFVAGSRGGLTVLSTADGSRLARRASPAPIWDGLAAAPGRLLLAAEDGSVTCLGKAR